MITALTRRKLVIAAGVVALLAVSGTVGRIAALNRPADGEPVTVEIEPGMSAAGIASLLETRGLIRSALLFRVVSKLRGYDRDFRAGTQPIDPGMTTATIARLLTRNPPIPSDIRVTVVEGLNITETAEAVAVQTAVDSSSFATVAQDTAYARRLGIDKGTFEGYLYPDTYFVRPEADAAQIIARMTARFHTVIADSLRARASEMGMTVHEVVTLASIIELETVRDEERPIVSQVFHRRLALGRPLEANPTIQYALGEKRRVLNEDLDIDSPYNTYLHAGLPPGPIASPGEASLRAALYPADTKYLYFVSDGSGGHVFSRTLAEHLRAVRRYRRERRRSRTNE